MKSVETDNQLRYLIKIGCQQKAIGEEKQGHTYVAGKVRMLQEIEYYNGGGDNFIRSIRLC